MKNFWTIYRYEIKKTVCRKLFWAATALYCLRVAVSAFSPLIGTYYLNGVPVESNSRAYKKDREYRRALSGRAVDDELLAEMARAHRRLPTDGGDIEAFEKYARPYLPIFNLVNAWTAMNLEQVQKWEAGESSLYELRRERLEKIWRSNCLTDREKDFWREKEAEAERPLIYESYDGYERILRSFSPWAVFTLLFSAVCLSNLFAREHSRKTDRLVLSCVRGRKTAYRAKILAGVTISFASGLATAVLTAALSLSLYGTQGFDRPLRLQYGRCSYPLTVGQACFIAYGVVLVTSILAAVFVMVLSEAFCSGVAALSVSWALIFRGGNVMFPNHYRLISQIWDWSPMTCVMTGIVFDVRTLPLRGHYFTCWQVVPVIYLILAARLVILGEKIYTKYEISAK